MFFEFSYSFFSSKKASIEAKIKAFMLCLGGIFVANGLLFWLISGLTIENKYFNLATKRLSDDQILTQQYQLYLASFLLGAVTLVLINKGEILKLSGLKKGLFSSILQLFYKEREEPNSVRVGKDMKTGGYVDLYQENLRRHVHIVGGTGVGKTNLLKNMMEALIKDGESVIFLDMKAEKKLEEWVRATHKKYGREDNYKLLTTNNPDISDKLNPIKRDNFIDIKDIIMNSIVWSEEFYKEQSSSALSKVLVYYSGIKDSYKKHINIEDILKLLTRKEFFLHLEEQFSPFKGNELEVNHFISSIYSTESQKNISGLISNLENICSSNLGGFLGKAEISAPSTRELVHDNNFLYVQLNAMRNSTSSRFSGKLLLSDIVTSIGETFAKDGSFSKNKCTLIIDELADFATDELMNVPNKAGSAGVRLIASHQTFADLERVSPVFAKQFMGNMGTKIFFGTVENDEPEMISSAIGTQKTFKTTNVFKDNKTESFGSIRESDEFIIHPNEIRGLRIGEVVMVRRLYREGVFKIKVDLASENLIIPPKKEPVEHYKSPEVLRYKEKVLRDLGQTL